MSEHMPTPGFIEYNGSMIPVSSQITAAYEATLVNSSEAVADTFAAEQPSPKRRRITLRRTLGVAGISLAVIAPPIGHYVAESTRTTIMNQVPGPDYALTPGDAVHDFGVSIGKLIPGGEK